MRHLFTALALLLAVSTSTQAQIAFGVGATYVSDGGVFGLQANSIIGLSDKVDLSPSGSIWLEEGVDFSIDADLHYHLITLGDDIKLNPFAGLNYTAGPVSNIGLNLGISLQIATENGAIYIEPKYVVDVFDSFAFTAGYFF